MYTAAWLIETLQGYLGGFEWSRVNTPPTQHTVQKAGVECLECRIVSPKGTVRATHFSEELKTYTWHTLCYDSNTVQAHSLFACLRGSRTRGEHHITEALANKASVVLVHYDFFALHTKVGMHTVYTTNATTDDTSSSRLLPDLDTITFPYHNNPYVLIAVESVEHALTCIAHAVRHRYGQDTHCIAVSGSNGKTSTTQLLKKMFSTQYTVTGSEKNYNSVQGLAKSMIESDWTADYGIFECGIDKKGEMTQLVTMLDPDEAVLTNIGTAHVGNFDSRDTLIREKLSLGASRNNLQTFWLPETLDQRAEYLVQELFIHTNAKSGNRIHKNARLARHGPFVTGYLRAHSTSLDTTTIYLNDGKFCIPLNGTSGVYVFLTALSLARAHGINNKGIELALRSFEVLPGRGKIMRGTPTIIDYSYNASPESVCATLTWFAGFSQLKKIVILGGMRELGSDSSAYHKQVMHLIKELNFFQVFFVGREYTQCSGIRDMPTTWVFSEKYSELEQKIQHKFQLKYKNLKKVAVLLIGSRHYALDRLITTASI